MKVFWAYKKSKFISIKPNKSYKKQGIIIKYTTFHLYKKTNLLSKSEKYLRE